MKVQILQDGTYANFERQGKFNRVSMVQRVAGDVVDYPDYHAKWLIGKSLAEVYAESEAPPVAQTVLSATRPASKLAAELSIDLSTVTGSGKGGRVTVGDVRKAAE